MGAGAGGGVNYLLGALVDDLRIVSLEADSNALLFLGLSFCCSHMRCVRLVT